MFGESESKLEPEWQSDFDLWKRNPNPYHAGRLLKQVDPVIDKAIKTHVGQSNPIIRSRARRLALQSFDSYDPSKAKLGTHLMSQLQGLKRISRQQQQILHVPERVALGQAQLKTVSDELLDELGREPSVAELADRSGMSLRQIAKLRKYRQPVASGVFAPLSEMDDARFDPAVQQPESDTWLEFVYDDLDPTGQKILEWTLGLHGAPQLSNQEIAKKLRLTPGAISQRKAHIQSLMDEQQELAGG